MRVLGFLVIRACLALTPEDLLFSEVSVEDKILGFSHLLEEESDLNEKAYLADVISVLDRLQYHMEDVDKPKKKKKSSQKDKLAKVGKAAKRATGHSAHGIPVPPEKVSGQKSGSKSKSAVISADDLSFTPAFLKSISMILVSELGDKTFFIAAIMAMKHSRILVFSAAIAALAVMTVLSAAMGYALPALLPREYTHYASMVLFFIFGVRLLYDAYGMDPNAVNEELTETIEELDENEEADDDLEDGKKKKQGMIEQLNQVFSPIFVQTFTLTFLAEWGDRSQIATIALAAAMNPYGVTLGGIIGHSFCTGLAVLGGKLLATKISERMVATVGGILFLIFAVHSFIAGPE